MPIGAGDRHRRAGDAAEGPAIVGVLALQGAFAAHQDRLIALGAVAPAVRTPDDLVDLDGIVLPGGESTTMSMLLDTSGLYEPLTELIAAGLPVFGTCAGMILVAHEVLDGRPDQHGFERLDITVRRNGYGRQLDSFEADLQVELLDEPFHAVFIRAPLVVRVGAGVEVLATHEGAPVLVRDGGCTVASFHPELTADTRLHEMFLDSIRRPVPSTE
jgi:5'-phosphate synthase pdxT subunit